MLGREKDVVGISISEDLLKITHVRSVGGRQKVLGLVREPLEDLDETQWDEKIQEAVQSFGAKKPRAVCVIPSNMVTTKNIEIPSLDEEEIRSIIDLQAGRHTPYSREEILIGYVSIGVFQRNYTKVLLVIANRDVIKTRLEACESAGLRVEKVFFAPECVAVFYSKLLGIKPEDDPIAIIDITHTSTDFIVEHNQTVATSRSIPIGIQHLIEEGEEGKAGLIEELLNSLEIYRNEDINKVPERYILTSDVQAVKDLIPALKEKLGVEAQVVPYSQKVAVNDMDGNVAARLQDDSFLQLVSATHLLNQSFQVDLMPEEIKNQRAIEDKGRQVIIAGVFAMILLALVCGLFYIKIYFRDLYLDRLKKEYAIKQYQVFRLDKIADRTQVIKDYFQDRMAVLDILSELYYLIPNEMYLQNVFMDEEGTVNIQGVSESMSTVFDFVKALEDSPLFKSVKTRSTTAKKDRGKDAAAFDIVFKLTSAPDGPVSDSQEQQPAEKAGAAPAE